MHQFENEEKRKKMGSFLVFYFGESNLSLHLVKLIFGVYFEERRILYFIWLLVCFTNRIVWSF